LDNVLNNKFRCIEDTSGFFYFGFEVNFCLPALSETNNLPEELFVDLPENCRRDNVKEIEGARGIQVFYDIF
jgi:hypothetical protein